MDDQHFVLTAEGEAQLRQQLRENEEEAARLRYELGDLGDDPGGNLDADEAGAFFELQTSLEHAMEKIGHIQFVLERSQVAEGDPDPRRVDPGERVVVWDFSERRERTFDILASPEVELTYTRDQERRPVSMESPVGKALVGRQIGDVVEVEVPDGAMRFAIRRIERNAGS
jgi:transcription elongation factor GreA